MKARRARTYVLVGLGLGALAVGAAASWMVGSALIRPVNRPVPRPDGFQVRVVSIPGQGHALAGCSPPSLHPLGPLVDGATSAAARGPRLLGAPDRPARPWRDAGEGGHAG